ncbi:MAG: hypothetical protein VX830_13510 [Candidatus Poribacteria bacterium]|nr:hypothetical protein [Candidatus Poribacteria bacterium]
MTQKIGTLNEGPLHASIKKWYKKAGDKQEVEVDGYIIDLVRGDQLIEIQTANFSQISRKIVRLTNLHPLKLVYPVAQTKWLCKNGSRRKSPKRGRWLQLFDELVSIPQVLASDNFSIEIILVEIEEFRIESRSYRKGWKVSKRNLLSVQETMTINDPPQLAKLTFQETLAISFSTADLSEELKIPRRLAQRICYCLRQLGEIFPVSKSGNSILYTRK